MSKSIDSCRQCGGLHCVDPWNYAPVQFSELEDGLMPGKRRMWRYAKVIAGTPYQVCFHCRGLVATHWLTPTPGGEE